ncbi:MAG: hypothetical protein AB8B64_04250 [Granulosicoccus sp.]
MICRPYKAAMVLTLAFTTNSAFADPDNTYLESDGIIKFNVEDAQPVEGWELRTELPGYEGAGYLEWRGGNNFPSGSAGEGIITYHFRIAKAGNYQFRFRSHIAEGESNTEHNDSWVRLATGVDIPDEQALNGWTKVYMNTGGQWAWGSLTVDHAGVPVRQYFSEGDHTVELSGRSRGHAIDMIVLYKYDEVDYNTGSVNRWDLSEAVVSDGTVVTPGEYPDPEDNGTGNETDPETGNETDPVEEPEPEPEPVNLDIANDSWADIDDNACVGNTLALPAIDSAVFNPSDAELTYTAAEEMLITADSAVALFKFDLSLVPPVSGVELEYSTTELAANATLDYSLASHSLWKSETEDQQITQAPYVMLQLGTAIGGWQEESRHRSTLDPILLTSARNTIMLQAQSGSDSVGIFSHNATDLAPRLLVSGDDNFCSNLQANIDASAASVESANAAAEAVIAEVAAAAAEAAREAAAEAAAEVAAEAEEKANTDALANNEAETQTDSSGGSTSITGLFLLMLMSLRRLIRRETSPANH